MAGRVAAFLALAVALASHPLDVGIFARAASPSRRGPAVPADLAIVHVTVIDATGAPPRPDMTVVISQRRIARLGPTGDVKLAPDVRVIDARSKFLIPGLWRMRG